MPTSWDTSVCDREGQGRRPQLCDVERDCAGAQRAANAGGLKTSQGKIDGRTRIAGNQPPENGRVGANVDCAPGTGVERPRQHAQADGEPRIVRPERGARSCHGDGLVRPSPPIDRHQRACHQPWVEVVEASQLLESLVRHMETAERHCQIRLPICARCSRIAGTLRRRVPFRGARRRAQDPGALAQPERRSGRAPRQAGASVPQTWRGLTTAASTARRQRSRRWRTRLSRRRRTR